MKTGLLEEIKAAGYWRVNFRPIRNGHGKISLARCRELVETSRVSMRGWDFPHISYPRHDDPDIGGYSNEGDHVENWTDWSGFKEFWRMYRSTQFISYVALREDTMRSRYGNGQFSILDVNSTVYSITEFFEFARRLSLKGIYDSGISVAITLLGVQARLLSAGANRFPFLEAHTTNAAQVDFKVMLQPHQVKTDHFRSLAVEACIEIFDQFGWNPAPTQIEAEQDKFFQRLI